MKKYIIGFLICVVVVLSFGASTDRRNLEPNTKKIFRVEIPQMSRVNGDANDVDDTVNVNGTIRQITVGVNNNTGNKTVLVSLVDDNGSVLFTTETIAEDTNSAPIVQHFMTESSTDLPLAILVTGLITVDVNLSGDPGTSGMVIDVVLYGD